jgi:NitT/TauT family transport system permease protein
MKTFFTRNRLLVGLGVLTIVVLWKSASVLVASPELVPAPEQVMIEFARTIISVDALPDIGATLVRGLAGFALATVAALIFGVAAGARSAFNAFFLSFLVIMRATPVVAFILLLLIWFDTVWVPVIIAFITMFPIIYTNVARGVQEVDPALREMVRVYRIPAHERLRSVYLPSVSAFLFSGISTALGFGWRAIIIGEVLSQPPHGIGARLREAFAYFDVKQVISWTVCAVLISYGFEWIVSGIEKRTVRWKAT